jgi:mRNA interferase MazF
MVRPANNFDIPVADWRAAGLIKPSVVKPVIATIEKTLVIKRLGRLGEQDRKTLTERLQTILR